MNFTKNFEYLDHKDYIDPKMGITSCWILKNAIIRINKYMFLIFLETHCHSICFFSLLSLKFRTMMGLFINMKCIGNFFHAFSSQM